MKRWKRFGAALLAALTLTATLTGPVLAAEPEGESPRTALSWAVEAELMGLPEDEEAPVTQRELARTLARLEQALNPEEEVPPEEGQNGQESTDQLPQEGSKTEQAAQKV